MSLIRLDLTASPGWFLYAFSAKPPPSARGFPEAGDQKLGRIVATLKERAKTVGEMADMATFYFVAPKAYDPKSLKKWWNPESPALLRELRATIGELPLDDEPRVEEAFRKLAEQKTGGNLGKVAQPVRIALTGSAASPSLFSVMAILGKEECQRRFDAALGNLEGNRGNP